MSRTAETMTMTLLPCPPLKARVTLRHCQAMRRACLDGVQTRGSSQAYESMTDASGAPCRACALGAERDGRGVREYVTPESAPVRGAIPPHVAPLLGRTLGKLRVVDAVQGTGGRWLAVAVCDCGTKTKVRIRAGALQSTSCRACGNARQSEKRQLTDDQVRAIRRLGQQRRGSSPAYAIAKELGLTYSIVRGVLEDRNYRDVPDLPEAAE